MRNEIFPAISVNKDVTSHQRFQPPSMSWWALSILRKENICYLIAIRVQPLPVVSPKGAQDVKNMGYWPRADAMHRKGMISGSPDSWIFQTLASSHTYKSAKLLNLGYQGFHGDSNSKQFACHAGDLGSIPGLRWSSEGNGSPLQYSCLEKSMDRGAWEATVHGVISPINWDIWFSLINNNLLMFRLPALCCKTSI